MRDFLIERETKCYNPVMYQFATPARTDSQATSMLARLVSSGIVDGGKAKLNLHFK